MKIGMLKNVIFIAIIKLSIKQKGVKNMGELLFGLLVLANLILWPILGLLKLSSGDPSGLIPILIVSVIGLIFYNLRKNGNKNLDKRNKWRKDAFEQNGIDANGIKFQIKNMNNAFIYLVYTNDKRLFFVNENKEYINQIALNKILKIETQANIQEKQKQQVIALTTTFYTTQKVLSYILKVITEDNTIIITTFPTYENKEIIERFKLLIERDIDNYSNKTIKKMNLNKNS